MNEKDAMHGIKVESRNRAKADETKREATKRLRWYIKAAQENGISISQIAREAGLSRQGVYDLLAGRAGR